MKDRYDQMSEYKTKQLKKKFWRRLVKYRNEQQRKHKRDRYALSLAQGFKQQHLQVYFDRMCKVLQSEKVWLKQVRYELAIGQREDAV
jgi:hypothetical protein